MKAFRFHFNKNNYSLSISLIIIPFSFIRNPSKAITGNKYELKALIHFDICCWWFQGLLTICKSINLKNLQPNSIFLTKVKFHLIILQNSYNACFRLHLTGIYSPSFMDGRVAILYEIHGSHRSLKVELIDNRVEIFRMYNWSQWLSKLLFEESVIIVENST